MVSLRGLTGKGAIGKILVPLASGGATEYVMKTVAFNVGGNSFTLPRPAPDIIKNTGEWIGQPHIIAGFALAIGLPAVIGRRRKGIADRFQSAALGYLGGKYVSENFGVSRSPFRTSPKGQDIPESENSVNPFRRLDRI